MAKHKDRVSIKDIAEHLQLSNCTVSKILSGRLGHAKYSPHTIQRVREAAGKLGYRPNILAQALVQGRTWTVGLCLADISNPVFGEFAAQVERGAASAGYGTFVCNAGEDPEAELRYVQTLIDRRVDVLVLSPVSTRVHNLIRHALRTGCRVILFDREIEGLAAPAILVNNRETMRELTSRCLSLGHRRVGVLAGNPKDHSLQRRLAGVREALQEAGRNPRSCLTVAKSAKATTAEAGAAGVDELLSRRTPPTLILSLANFLSLGALRAFSDHDLKPGKDIAFAGFDDFWGADVISGGISVAAQPVSAMAQACVEMITAERPPTKPKRFAAEILWRESVGAIGE